MTDVRKRVLIVDDYQPFRAAARELLEDAGFVVIPKSKLSAAAFAALVD